VTGFKENSNCLYLHFVTVGERFVTALRRLVTSPFQPLGFSRRNSGEDELKNRAAPDPMKIRTHFESSGRRRRQ
jgi:hypothetical protein